MADILCHYCEEESIRIPEQIVWGTHHGETLAFCVEECREECLSESDGYYYCEDCQQRCSPGVRDYGIGHYEYWGATGVDVQLALVSDCCEQSVYDNPALAGQPVSRFDWERENRYW